jgi:hypothetical protein
MTLDLAALLADLQVMSETMVEVDQTRRSALQIARQRLTTYADAVDDILKKVQITREQNLHWRGSYPATDERLDACHPCPTLPSRVNIIANDGSQVPIDRHAATLFYALNIGYVIYPYGTDGPPHVEARPSLHFRDEEILDDSGELIPNAVVNARRTVREMENLADVATAYAQFEPPLVVLSDGPLIWVQPGRTPQERRRNLEPYLAGLERLKKARAALGGYVDRPRSNGFLSQLQLATLRPEELTRERLDHNDMIGLTDARLFAQLLRPGERSALFIRQSPMNALYADKSQEIWHFYLNVSDDPSRPLIVRIESPGWVGENQQALDLLHAAVCQQCGIVGTYPYVLARAHELALISSDERRDLETMVVGALRRQGLEVRTSEKAWQKALTGGTKRRHRL